LTLLLRAINRFAKSVDISVLLDSSSMAQPLTDGTAPSTYKNSNQSLVQTDSVVQTCANYHGALKEIKCRS